MTRASSPRNKKHVVGPGFIPGREPSTGSDAGNLIEGVKISNPDGNGLILENCGLEINFRRIRKNPRITVHTLATVDGLSGIAGGEYFMGADPGEGNAATATLG